MEDESTAVLVEERPASYGRSRSYLLTGEVSPAELRIKSKALLYCIIYGNNSAGRDRLLRELYWHTIDILAHLDSDK